MVVQAEQVEKTYGQFHLQYSMNVKEGMITGLVGQNGSGKTTLFKTILGLIRSEGGTLRVLGEDPEKFTSQTKAQIGVVLADSGFGGYLTVKEIANICERMYQEFDKDEFLGRCEEFEIPLKKPLQQFSTGMAAKLKVLAALSHRARLLILDEPTAGLDVVARDAILNLLREYMEEEEDRAILISSHISSDLEGICDDIYMIHQGEIVMHEETDTLLSEYGLLKVSEEQYGKLEKRYLLRRKKEAFGYSCLTDQKQFYLENYPDLVIEKGSVDEMMMMVIKGERI